MKLGIQAQHNLWIRAQANHHPTGNFSPTSMQPRAMKLGIQAQLNLPIKVGQEKK